jgi:hypothetical protein
MAQGQEDVGFALLPVVKPVLEVLKEVSCVNLFDRTRVEGGEVFEGVSLDLVGGVLAEAPVPPNVVVYAVINVDPAGLVVGAGSEVDAGDQTFSHCFHSR